MSYQFNLRPTVNKIIYNHLKPYLFQGLNLYDLWTEENERLNRLESGEDILEEIATQVCTSQAAL